MPTMYIDASDGKCNKHTNYCEYKKCCDSRYAMCRLLMNASFVAYVTDTMPRT